MTDFYTIQLPRVAGSIVEEEPLLACVRWDSPISHRRAVERIAHYFRREFRYDFVQFDLTEKDKVADAYLFLAPAWGEAPLALGACCFRWRKWADVPHGWALQWIWIHPYERRRGILSSHWPFFCKKFENFFVEPPLSYAMEAFLKAQSRQKAKSGTIMP